MDKVVGLGIQDFGQVIRDGALYIDKTQFISEWWDSKDSVTLITRPRRFGKTLMLSAVETFFSNRQKDAAELFRGFKVTEDAEVLRELGKWPVLFISFASIKESTYDGALAQFGRLFSKIASEFYFMKDNLNEIDTAFYEKFKGSLDEGDIADCINTFCKWLHDYYGKNVLLLIDEYDTPMQEAFVQGYWDKMIGFMRKMFNAALKTNTYLYRALLTGITRVSRESLFSDLNNLRVITGASDKYADCFGFTEKEVFSALEQYGLGTEKEKVKKWYDGFKFGSKEDIYNPWSILSFLQERKYEPYWANTSSNSLVSKIVREGDSSIKEMFEELLRGGTISTTIDEQLVYGEMSGDPNAVWSLLLAGGYLRVVSIEGDGALAQYRLKLTNHEVKDCFSLMVTRWFENAGKNYSYFVKALIEGNVDDMTDSLSEICERMMSSFDGSGRTEPENFYHGLILGLLVELRERYEIQSNRESGLGRYDVMLRPKDTKDVSIIIEFKAKRRSEKDKSLEELASIALKQIEDKRYESVLLEAGIEAGKIRKYAFVFEGKNLLIKENK